uniref:Uncharacterized protein n=1 Tax=Biomphalaria glabrata TaxID=6526 RepID=A0A2C9K1U9_BIOGL
MEDQDTRWASKDWGKDIKTQYWSIKESKLHLKDLDIGRSPKFKLLVRLKLLPKDMKKKRIQKFLTSLLKAVAYEECLFLELDNDVVKHIGNVVKSMKKKVTGIVRTDDIDEYIKASKQNNDSLKSAYASFEHLILTGTDSIDIGIDIDVNEKIYICEVVLNSKEEDKNLLTNEDGDEDGCENDDDNDEENNNSCENDEDENMFEDFYYSDDEDDDDDDEDEDNDENEDDFDKNDDSDSDCSQQTVMSKETTNTKKCARIFIEQDQGPTPGNKYLSLKDAYKVNTLRQYIYEETIKQYKLLRNEINAFYLSLSLKHVDENLTSGKGKKLNWKADDLKEVLKVVLNDFKTEFLEQLLDHYKPHSTVIKVMQEVIAEDVVETKDEDEEDEESFLDSLDS